MQLLNNLLYCSVTFKYFFDFEEGFQTKEELIQLKSFLSTCFPVHQACLMFAFFYS